ncbi:ribonuclease H2, subunit C [Schizophyllum amplum]|uniref:Ribonuclease H2, subunit C n=1 Tax=Schizophyllum amplum TaxID=97359 RepID=A0A550C062_9AGAR|nr:ribonuclease H2, subunit C [Auriculariopsis ampla]
MSLSISSSCDVRKLPTADPNLVPFHINHTGPAPVSTYFIVDAAKGNVGAPDNGGATTSTSTAGESSLAGPLKTTNIAAACESSSAPKRVVSAFRGRTVHGLRVDVPEGYLGVVLHADGQPTSHHSRDTKPQKGRPRRGKKTTPIDDADESIMFEDAQKDADIRPSRLLNPVSQFSSFLVWGADIPVDEGRDEYVRALTEWTTLAAEIHRMD